jgi:hypothetical protein
MTMPSACALPEACLLTQTGVYEEYLTLRPIEALPDSHDVRIQSRLNSAAAPHALQTRYHSAMNLEALERLHHFLGDYLAKHRSQQTPVWAQEGRV